jgi:hypothetical protein
MLIFNYQIYVMGLSTMTPLFIRVPFRVKEGLGEIFQSVNKIPLYPPLSKGDLKENKLFSMVSSIGNSSLGCQWNNDVSMFCYFL